MSIPTLDEDVKRAATRNDAAVDSLTRIAGRLFALIDGWKERSNCAQDKKSVTRLTGVRSKHRHM